jgi:two-component system sensor kinase FixL
MKPRFATICHISLGFACLLLSGGFSAGADLSAAPVEAKRVLILHSFGSAAPPFTTHSTAFETTLTEENGERVDLDEVSLDVARYATLDMEDALVDFIRKRQARWQPDLVVPIGSPAGVFVAKYRNRLFPTMPPVIYVGMDQRRLPPDALEQNAAFVGESFNLGGLVEDILQVAPATTNIAVVIGASPIEQYWKDVLQREYQPFTNRVSFTWFNDLSLDQMLARSARLPPRSFILLILLMRDAAGVAHNADEALIRFHHVANAPINGIFQHQLGLGIVGGRLYQAELEGVEAAHIAVRILHGEAASSFPPKIVEPLSPRYDWRELQRWNIDQNRLPPGHMVFFQRRTVWQRNRSWMLPSILVFILQTILIVALVANLAKRRRAERTLAESEARFRLAADEAPVLIWMSGLNKLCTFFNKPWLEFRGRTLEQEMGNGWTEGVHPDDLERCLKTYVDAVDKRQPFVMEYRLRRFDGAYRWLFDSGRPRFDAQGNFAGYIGSCADVTERKRTDEKFRLAVEASLSAIVMVNEQGQIVLVNSLTERAFGYARAELLGQAFDMLLPERHRTEVSSHGSEAFATPAPRPLKLGRELFARRKDGSEFPVEIGLHPIQVEEETLVLAAINDLTERRRADSELQRQRQELAHVSRVSLVGELSASIAHELNQPLTAILANAQAAQRFLAADKLDLNEFREILNDIASVTIRARDVIQNVRALVKKGEQDFSEVSMDKVIRAVVSLLQSDIAARHGRLELELAPELPAVRGNPIQLQQVLVNLTLNAFDAMEGLAATKRHAIISAKAEPGNGVRVSVRDCGAGIPPDKLETIFQSFYTTKSKGMGLGLSVTRSIVEAHSGRIWAENHSEGGAVFYLMLPVVNGDAEREMVMQPASERS